MLEEFVDEDLLDLDETLEAEDEKDLDCFLLRPTAFGTD